MRIKIDIDICCPNCGEQNEIDYQITRETVGRGEIGRELTGKLLVDTICNKCHELHRQRVEH